MDIRIFSLTFLLVIQTVTAQRLQVYGVINDSVVLPCEFKQNSQTVFWRFKDSKSVCEIINGEVDFEEQDLAYRNRVQIFLSEIEKGNFSIMLYNLKESDAGLYDCIAPNHQTVILELIVTDREPASRTRSANGQWLRRADARLTILLASALLYSVTF